MIQRMANYIIIIIIIIIIIFQRISVVVQRFSGVLSHDSFCVQDQPD